MTARAGASGLELDHVCREAARLDARGVPRLLGTVVRVTGSSYRRPGARMLIAEDQRRVGCVSGGCLEADLVRRGEFRVRAGAPVLVRYDGGAEGELGSGTGCQGVVEVLIERLGPHGEHDPLTFAREVIDAESTGVMVTVFESRTATIPVGSRLFLRGGSATTTCPMPTAWTDIAAEATSPHPRIASYGDVTALVETISAPPRVYVVGTGHDALPLMKLAQAIGYRVTVASEHASIALRERFATADELLIAPPSKVALAIDRRHAALVVLMTHDFERDRAHLGWLLTTRARYIGVLGPERRTSRLLAELARSGHRVSADALARVYAPAGLDVGAETPSEIALAILAEMQATLAGASAGSLRARKGAVHAEGSIAAGPS